MNTYSKFAPNVFVAKCEGEHKKGEIITLQTKYGKEVKNEVHNFMGKTRDGLYLYSITRVDGLNSQDRAASKAEKLEGYAANAEKRSDAYYEASNEGRDFLSLGEPIKIGHHSERRHRKLIERNWERMGKSIAESEKAKEYERRAEYWKERASKIDLSTPDCLEFFEEELRKAKEKHQLLKDKPELRSHSMSLQYANKAVKDLHDKVILAVKLWGSDEEIAQINKEKEEAAEKKLSKKSKFDEAKEKLGGFFFFGSNMDDFKAKYQELLKNGYVEEGEKVCHIVAGLYVPVKHKDEFIKAI